MSSNVPLLLLLCLSLSLHHPSPRPFYCLFVSGGGWHAASVNEAEVDGSGNSEFYFPFLREDNLHYCTTCFIKGALFFPAVFSFPPLPTDESLIGVGKPLPKQLWVAKKVRVLLTLLLLTLMPGWNFLGCLTDGNSEWRQIIALTALWWWRLQSNDGKDRIIAARRVAMSD